MLHSYHTALNSAPLSAPDALRATNVSANDKTPPLQRQRGAFWVLRSRVQAGHVRDLTKSVITFTTVLDVFITSLLPVTVATAAVHSASMDSRWRFAKICNHHSWLFGSRSCTCQRACGSLVVNQRASRLPRQLAHCLLHT